MKGKVLLVGHCVPDTSRIVHVLDKLELGYESAHTVSEGIEKLREEPFILALPNRVIAGNEEGGVNFIKGFKAEDDISGVPAMLVSGIPSAQQHAVECGALEGFSKDELETGGAEKKIAALL